MGFEADYMCIYKPTIFSIKISILYDLFPTPLAKSSSSKLEMYKHSHVTTYPRVARAQSLACPHLSFQSNTSIVNTIPLQFPLGPSLIWIFLNHVFTSGPG